MAACRFVCLLVCSLACLLLFLFVSLCVCVRVCVCVFGFVSLLFFVFVCSLTAESFGVSAQIGSGVVRGGPQVRFHEGSIRVP